MNRREFLAGAASLALTSRPFELGVASYSLRKLSRTDAIRAIREIGTPYVNIKSFHLPYEASAEERATWAGHYQRSSVNCCYD